MTTVNEAVGNNKPPLGATLEAGVDFLSAGQTVTFQLYKKMVLPLDGFVFWINANLLTVSTGDPPVSRTIKGSLHYSTETEQQEDATVSINTIVFTAIQPCDILNSISPQYIYLASYAGIQFSFNSQGKYYQQADLWHYVGVAIKSIHGSQIVDDVNTLNSLSSLIVSNSLPIWLSMPLYVPPYPGFTCPIPLIYPSFLVDSNEPPPYASVHIEDVRALEAIASINSHSDSTQLTSEIVKVTTYGVDNDTIITFLNFVIQFSSDWGYIGIMNTPIINDLKDPHSEIQAISQKKEIIFKISYVQSLQNSRNITRQLIRHAIVTFRTTNVTINPHEKKKAA